MLLRNLFLKLKRIVFKRLTGLNPEDVKRLVYVQKYLDRHERKIKSYADYVKSEWSKKYENKCNN